MKKRILFVDDEPFLLQGLKRMLKSMRREWHMAFAVGGQEALEFLAREPFEIIVSDLHMPVMDGNQLLTEVMIHYPHIVRIMLSGTVDSEITLKSLKVTHQYVLKPCNAEVLKATIDSTFELRKVLSDEKLKGIISGIGKLPSLPSLYAEIMQELMLPDASIKKVSEIISKDIGMTAKILQIVNSAFFGLCQHVSSPEQAAVYLGLDALKSLALTTEVFEMFNQSAMQNMSIDRLLRHSALVGACARKIAEEENCDEDIIGDSLMAGMLHDVGKLVLSVYMPDKYEETFALASTNGYPLWKAELQTFGTTHAEVGAYLLGIWGLPDSIVEALAFHHNPQRSCLKKFTPLTTVHVANVFVYEIPRNEDTKKTLGINLDYISELGMADNFPQWRRICQEVIQGEAATK